MFCRTGSDNTAVKIIIKTGDAVIIINKAHALNMRNKSVIVIELAGFLELTPHCNQYYLNL